MAKLALQHRGVGLVGGWALAAAAAAAGFLDLAEPKVAAGAGARLPGQARLSAAQPGSEAGPSAARVVELRAASSGHYRARAEINGCAVDVLVDSGASLVVLSHDDAKRAGLSLSAQDYTQRVSTANGETRVAPVILDRISIGDITVRNVEAAVGEPGKLARSLLGMTFLGRLGRVDMRAGVLTLRQ